MGFLGGDPKSSQGHLGLSLGLAAPWVFLPQEGSRAPEKILQVGLESQEGKLFQGFQAPLLWEDVLVLLGEASAKKAASLLLELESSEGKERRWERLELPPFQELPPSASPQALGQALARQLKIWPAHLVLASEGQGFKRGDALHALQG